MTEEEVRALANKVAAFAETLEPEEQKLLAGVLSRGGGYGGDVEGHGGRMGGSPGGITIQPILQPSSIFELFYKENVIG